MIKVTGYARRSFLFPDACRRAYAFYSDVGRFLDCLPHICLVRTYGPDRFRLLYEATELGTYRVRILADVQIILEADQVLRIEPLDDIPPVEATTSAHAVLAQGHYSSRTTFSESDGKTHIAFSMRIWAQLPTPPGLRLLPRRAVNHVAKRATNMRVREITSGFIERSAAIYPHWLAEMQNAGPLPEAAGPRTVPDPDPDCLKKLDQQA